MHYPGQVVSEPVITPPATPPLVVGNEVEQEAPRTPHASRKSTSVKEILQSGVNADFREAKLQEKLTVRNALAINNAKTHRDRFVINPEFHTALQYWDLVTVGALAFVSLVTPPEVALSTNNLDAMFYLNCIIDGIFVIDMILQFFLVYRIKTPYGFRYEGRQRKIALHYLKTWFAVDLLSILPFSYLGLVFDSEELKKAKLMKIIRLLRLIRLMRVLRASRLFQRWETSVAINYNSLRFWLAFTVFFVSSHWFACTWALLAERDSPEEETWFSRVVPDADPEESAVEVYFTSLYWSSMTVTSIGYGDVLPTNIRERVVCTILMFCSGLVWAYALGEILAAVNNINIHEARFRQTLDDLNYMMADRNLSKAMQIKLRSFFFQIKDVQRVRSYQQLIDQMSPALQGQVAFAVNETWLRKVWYFSAKFHDFSPGFMASLSSLLAVSVYGQKEIFGEPWTLYILHKGLCARCMKMLRAGSVWGEDFILQSPELIDQATVLSLTFVESAYVQKVDFVPLLERFPEVGVIIRRAVVRIAANRGIVREAARRRQERGLQLNSSERTKTFLSFANSMAPMLRRSPLPSSASSMPSSNERQMERLKHVIEQQGSTQKRLEAEVADLSSEMKELRTEMKAQSTEIKAVNENLSTLSAQVATLIQLQREQSQRPASAGAV
eukprot:TRINITY_DN76558_c0_g1_i1.p1 TRINITY_DN76558_c0_g1~~TRINITY_DN76558_c0_g1_i1.p1  ORF type:complete len:692 (-),score=113.86 TRINITY_DN76558_c0_g1_i1:37-2046(-)